MEMNALLVIENGEVVLSRQASAELSELETLIEQLKERETYLKARLLEDMEQSGILKLETPELVINYIAPTDRESFDSKAFRKDHPEQYDDYVRISPVKSSIRVKVK